MKCTECRKREAVSYYWDSVDGVGHLCRDCWEKKVDFAPDPTYSAFLNHLIDVNYFSQKTDYSEGDVQIVASGVCGVGFGDEDDE